MKKQIYGCACCSPEFGIIFNANKTVARLSSMNPSEVAADRNQDPVVKKLDRRTFIKGSLAAAGTAGLLPLLSSCSQPREVAASTAEPLLLSVYPV